MGRDVCYGLASDDTPIPLRVNSSGQLVLAAGAGDDDDLSRKLVTSKYNYANVTATGATTIKAGPGVLGRITLNKTAAAAVMTIYDGTTATYGKIGTITLPTTLLSDLPPSREYDVAFQDGLYITVSGSAMDFTVAYL